MTVAPSPDFLFRLKQACCLFFYTWSTLGWPFCSTALLLYSLYLPILRPFAFLYLAWLIYDWKTPNQGSRPVKWARQFFVWKIVADYFPIKTVKTAEIPADRNYIFAAHPHGVLGTSSALMFGTDATQFQTLFPGIQTHAVTIPVNFVFPIRREFLMALGVITSDAESIGNVLGRPQEGNAIGIVPGGIAEMIVAKPGDHKLILANRKGFVKLAIKYGADLVPVYNFGEDEVFISVANPEGGWIWRYQQFSRRLNGLCFPLFYGCSFLSAILPEKFNAKMPKILRYGVIPFNTPIVSVVGAPIRVEKCENPSQSQIDTVHGEYCQQLKAIFDKYKCELGGLPECAQLEFI